MENNPPPIFIYTSPMILLITNQLDSHPNLVIEKLNALGVPLFRLNTDCLLTDYDITYTLKNDNISFSLKYKNGTHSISSDEITCVWERRPMEPLYTLTPFDNKDVEKVLLDEADGFMRFFRYALTGMDLFWIGHPINERRAQSKILQKIIARRLGFNIPKTIFTNEYSTITNLDYSDLAIKPISSDHIPYDDSGDLVFYTRRVSAQQIIDLGKSSFENNINFIEEYTDKLYELRVTLIKDECFAAKIDSQVQKEEEGAVDWRQGYDYGIKFSPTTIPESIAQKCKEYLHYFDLNFGCFDFIVNKEGEYIFLECNTNGQWVWLEEEARLPISQKFADVLKEEYERRKKR